ncbi:conserved hypothetical protein [Lodderomyces elongisporus NRRL YB-4239]|uniref:Uncharacterized protein n=1 Tax=Lodderomyces elongisporus (strain ATCC 11503 / CBS 2605 / JCM 1781 / NBRC 1676 / NRRL YB-4239) TaxID=379508 RepID=A5E776_LODEL|nr:conserved hypothetical protein [Lodderomyces elongisporus NRRL YB-4239]
MSLSSSASLGNENQAASNSIEGSEFQRTRGEREEGGGGKEKRGEKREQGEEEEEEDDDDDEEEEERLRRRRSAEEEYESAEAESVASALPEGFKYTTPTSSKEKKQPPILVQKYTKYQPIILNIVHGSIWGVLVRKGLMLLTSYDGSYLSGVIWANFTACLVMGFAVDNDSLWLQLLSKEGEKAGLYPTKASIPVYTGLTTGFCGTVSSFSTVILDSFNRAANTNIGHTYHPPNAAYGIMNFLAVVLAEFGLSVTGFHMGKHLSSAIASGSGNKKFSISPKQYILLERFSMIMAICLVVITCVLLGVKDEGAWRNWTFAMFFAPFGAILRFYMSKYLNSTVANFPMGTFSANLLGSLFLAIFTLLGRGKLTHGSQLVTHIMGCHVLTGLDDGFCGALTTVSTFVAELFGLKTQYSYRYGVASVLLSFAVMVLILGSYNWTVGLTDPVC